MHSLDNYGAPNLGVSSPHGLRHGSRVYVYTSQDVIIAYQLPFQPVFFICTPKTNVKMHLKMFFPIKNGDSPLSCISKMLHWLVPDMGQCYITNSKVPILYSKMVIFRHFTLMLPSQSLSMEAEKWHPRRFRTWKPSFLASWC